MNNNMQDGAGDITDEMKERNNAQYLWFALLQHCGKIKDVDEDVKDYAEYARLFEKLFENGGYRQDFDHDALNQRAQLKLKSFTAGEMYYYNHVKDSFINHLIGRGVIKSREEFVNGVLNVIFNVSIGGSLEELQSLERPNTNGSGKVDFADGDRVIDSVKASSSGQLPA